MKPTSDTLETDSLVADTVKVHSFKKAALLSTILPGAGQIYNSLAMPKGKRKAFWKVPLIYAGIGTGIFFIVKNQSKINQFKAEYDGRQTNGGFPINPELAFYNDQAILSLFYQRQTRRDLAILGTFLVYGFQILDAAVEAHFVKFDVSKNLQAQILPTIYSTRGIGFRAVLNFH